jgi:hypothetical protein
LKTTLSSSLENNGFFSAFFAGCRFFPSGFSRAFWGFLGSGNRAMSFFRGNQGLFLLQFLPVRYSFPPSFAGPDGIRSTKWATFQVMLPIGGLVKKSAWQADSTCGSGAAASCFDSGGWETDASEHLNIFIRQGLAYFQEKNSPLRHFESLV